MLHHSFWGAVIFLSLQPFIAPAMDLIPWLPSRHSREARKALNSRKEQPITETKKVPNTNVWCTSLCRPKANLSKIQHVNKMISRREVQLTSFPQHISSFFSKKISWIIIFFGRKKAFYLWHLMDKRAELDLRSTKYLPLETFWDAKIFIDFLSQKTKI